MASAALRLYRELVRRTRQLPRWGPRRGAELIRQRWFVWGGSEGGAGGGGARASRSYYRKHLKENFVAHQDETDAARVAEIMLKARQDADWILAKVPEAFSWSDSSWKQNEYATQFGVLCAMQYSTRNR